MTDKLTTLQAQILIIVLGTALAALITAVSFLFVSQSQLAVNQASMSDKYVLIQRYNVDRDKVDALICRLEDKFDVFAGRIDGKLDKIILQQR